MKVLFSETAHQELDEAVAYLELEFNGLGYRFKEKVNQALQRIARHPTAWSIELGDIRNVYSINFLVRSCIP